MKGKLQSNDARDAQLSATATTGSQWPVGSRYWHLPLYVVSLPRWLSNVQLQGPFSVGDNGQSQLQSLENMCNDIKGTFTLGNTQIKSLQGGPSTVQGNVFIARNSRMTSLQGAPSIIEGDLEIESCPIKDLTGLENTTVVGKLTIFDCPLTSASGLPKMNSNWSVIRIDGKKHIYDMFRQVWDGSIQLMNQDQTTIGEKDMENGWFSWDTFWTLDMYNH